MNGWRNASPLKLIETNASIESNLKIVSFTEIIWSREIKNE